MAICQSSQKRDSAHIKKFPLRIFLVQVFAILLFSEVVAAQSKFLPTVEVFGGYSHLSLQTGALGLGNRKEAGGFDFALTIPHIFKDLGVTADVSGDYATTIKQYNFFVGPQYKWDLGRFNLIAHGLYGRSETRLEHPGSTFLAPSDRQRSLAFGGEVDLPIKSGFLWRIGQGDYVITSAFGNSEKNIRVSTGLIYRFGKH